MAGAFAKFRLELGRPGASPVCPLPTRAIGRPCLTMRDLKRSGASAGTSADWTLPSSSPTSPDALRSPKRARVGHAVQAAPRSVSMGTPAAKKQAAAPPSPPQGEGPQLWLVVGLGNPGANYERTRHNVGFMAIDELAKAHDIDCRKLEKSAAVGRGTIEGQQVLLVKPMTFMNNSGESVSALAKFYKVPTQRILVISDDLDIAHAALRMRARGGHGGHNGLRSIVERLGNCQDFPRIKIGIGRPAGQIGVSNWVLQDFTRKEMEDIDITVQQTCDAVRSVMALGLEKALSGIRAATESAALPKPKQATPPASVAPGQAAATANQQRQAVSPAGQAVVSASQPKQTPPSPPQTTATTPPRASQASRPLSQTL